MDAHTTTQWGVNGSCFVYGLFSRDSLFTREHRRPDGDSFEVHLPRTALQCKAEALLLSQQHVRSACTELKEHGVEVQHEQLVPTSSWILWCSDQILAPENAHRRHTSATTCPYCIRPQSDFPQCLGMRVALFTAVLCIPCTPTTLVDQARMPPHPFLEVTLDDSLLHTAVRHLPSPPNCLTCSTQASRV